MWNLKQTEAHREKISYSWLGEVWMEEMDEDSQKVQNFSKINT